MVSVDPVPVLQAAQASVVARGSIACAYRTRSMEYLVSPATGQPPTELLLEGNLLLSGGLWRVESRPMLPEQGRKIVMAWNGSALRTLFSSSKEPDRNRGSISEVPLNPHVAVPLWLFNARLGRVPLEVAGQSMFEHLLRQGKDLKADILSGPVMLPDITDPPPRVIRITGKLPWGDYEVWLDPAREYNFTRVVLKLSSLEGSGEHRVRDIGDKARASIQPPLGPCQLQTAGNRHVCR